MKRHSIAMLAALSAILTGVPVSAHHSAAMFDMTKTVTVNGTVKAWQFVNPHSWLQVMAVDADGSQVQWSFESGPPAGGGSSPNSAIHKDTFKPGDKVSVVTHPMKDGRHAGTMGEVTFADGHKWTPRSRQLPPPPTPAS